MNAVVISAMIYAGAFLYPSCVELGIFVYLLPILVSDRDNSYGFKAGYTWGIICFGLHLIWFATLAYANGKGNARILVYVAMVAYFSLYSGFWLWFKQLLVNRWVNQLSTKKGKCVALCCTWVISTVIFLYLTSYCSLAIFDCFDGYPFINPLLPIVSYHTYLGPIFTFNPVFLWILIVLCNFSITIIYNKSTNASLIFVIIIITCQSLFLHISKNNFVKNNDIFYLQPTWNNQDFNQAQLFYEIGRQLDTIAQHNPTTRYIVMPESAFPYNFMAWQDKIDVWTALFDHVTIFFGGHRHDDNGKVFNSLYQICGGKIVAWYDKSHLVPFVERMPRLHAGITLLKDYSCLFSYPIHDQLDVTMAEFQPCICSELFCEKKRPVKNRSVLFICNDSWLPLHYARDLAKRCAKLYSLRYQVPVLFVGWYDCGFL